MSVAGIVAEYNPFHHGHKYQIERAKELTGADFIIIVLSGSFVQRCEPAIISKWARAKMALSCGADLVIELPFPFSTMSAEGFARGAVSILNSLGCVDFLCFGSESGDLEELIHIKNALLSEKTDIAIKKHLESGITYAVARENAIKKECGEISSILKSPNNILAVEYLKAIHFFGSSIKPITIKRIGADYHENEIKGIFSSASHIRKLINENDVQYRKAMPQSATNILEAEPSFAQIAYIERAILATLRLSDKATLSSTPEISEGLEARLLGASIKAKSLHELLHLVKTKRYTLSRIRRIILWAFMGLKNEDNLERVPYLRVLGFNDKGRKILKKAKKTATVPIITKPARAVNILNEEALKIFNLEEKATDIWALCTTEITQGGLDKTQSAVYYNV